MVSSANFSFLAKKQKNKLTLDLLVFSANGEFSSYHECAVSLMMGYFVKCTHYGPKKRNFSRGAGSVSEKKSVHRVRHDS